MHEHSAMNPYAIIVNRSHSSDHDGAHNRVRNFLREHNWVWTLDSSGSFPFYRDLYRLSISDEDAMLFKLQCTDSNVQLISNPDSLSTYEILEKYT